MPGHVIVTPAQRAAAREILRRDAVQGRTSRPAVVKIANATRAGDEADEEQVRMRAAGADGAERSNRG